MFTLFATSMFTFFVPFNKICFFSTSKICCYPSWVDMVNLETINDRLPARAQNKEESIMIKVPTDRNVIPWIVSHFPLLNPRQCAPPNFWHDIARFRPTMRHAGVLLVRPLRYICLFGWAVVHQAGVLLCVCVNICLFGRCHDTLVSFWYNITCEINLIKDIAQTWAVSTNSFIMASSCSLVNSGEARVFLRARAFSGLPGLSMIPWLFTRWPRKPEQI